MPFSYLTDKLLQVELTDPQKFGDHFSAIVIIPGGLSLGGGDALKVRIQEIDVALQDRGLFVAAVLFHVEVGPYPAHHGPGRSDVLEPLRCMGYVIVPK